ncbi:hypothetical protein OPV22_002229 [Ensete ventricosum]|uniref:Uncharacterized protein n=1 Tax=Ensete ventricosum TaxID=4639 RepID=A0AAV8RXE8_ENSVE|nr:hypothetical protein OPV22_002229 [Ensete ventricosum]
MLLSLLLDCLHWRPPLTGDTPPSLLFSCEKLLLQPYLYSSPRVLSLLSSIYRLPDLSGDHLTSTERVLLLLPNLQGGHQFSTLYNQTRNKLSNFTLDPVYAARLRSHCSCFSEKYSHHRYYSNIGFVEHNEVLDLYFLLDDIVGLYFCQHCLSTLAPMLLSL